MNNLPKISVITVVFNAVDLIEQTIKSIVCQSYANIEYIVIDGLSNDGTLDIVKKYEKEIAYWTSEKDSGIYDAMNKGLKAASGDYVLFINAGDELFSSKTIDQIPFKHHPSADIFYGETIIIDDKSGAELGLRRKKLPDTLVWKHYKKGMVVCHQSILVRKTLAPYYNTNYKLSADVDWVIRCLKKSDETVFTNSIISKFLNGGVSRTNENESLKERFYVLKKYFGLPQTILSHIGFILDTILVKLKLKPLYRANHFKSQ